MYHKQNYSSINVRRPSTMPTPPSASTSISADEVARKLLGPSVSLPPPSTSHSVAASPRYKQHNVHKAFQNLGLLASSFAPRYLMLHSLILCCCIPYVRRT